MTPCCVPGCEERAAFRIAHAVYRGISLAVCRGHLGVNIGKCRRLA